MRIFSLYLILTISFCFSAEPMAFQAVELITKPARFEKALKNHLDVLEAAKREGFLHIESHMLIWQSKEIDAFGKSYGKSQWIIVRFKNADKILMCASRNLSYNSLKSLVIALGPNENLTKLSDIIAEDGLVFASEASNTLTVALIAD